MRKLLVLRPAACDTLLPRVVADRRRPAPAAMQALTQAGVAVGVDAGGQAAFRGRLSMRSTQNVHLVATAMPRVVVAQRLRWSAGSEP
jgi:hypothetical protein